MRCWLTEGEAETLELGRRLATDLAPSGTLLLYGDLGSGKTVLTRGVAAGLGIDPEQVQSPTFTLIREHHGKAGRMTHVDLYRLSPPEVDGLGLDELLEDESVTVIEWAERLPRAIAAELRLELRRGPSAGQREIREIAAADRLPGASRGGER